LWLNQNQKTKPMKPQLIIRIFSLILLTGFVTSCYSQNYPKHEMRALWIATVENIDWPLAKGLTTEQQKAEMIEILDQVKAYNMNTIVLIENTGKTKTSRYNYAVTAISSTHNESEPVIFENIK
jgi:uncharacterized lipoprotein YddW (UPF0748 family)